MLEFLIIFDELQEVVIFEVMQIEQGCFGVQDNQVMVIGFGGIGGFMYSWSNGQSMVMVIGLDIIFYIVIVIDDSGCIVVDMIFLVDFEEILFLIIINLFFCNGVVDGWFGINLIIGGNG